LVSGVVDRNKGAGLDDSSFEGFHGLCMFFLPDEGGTFASKVDKRSYDGGVVLDPYSHIASKTKEGMNVRKGFALRPIADS